MLHPPFRSSSANREAVLAFLRLTAQAGRLLRCLTHVLEAFDAFQEWYTPAEEQGATVFCGNRVIETTCLNPLQH